MLRTVHKKFKPGQKLKLSIPETQKTEASGRATKTTRICTVVKQYPNIVHMTYMITETDKMSISLTPWEINRYLVR